MSSKFEYMITYMDDKRIPSGNIENLIAIWRQMEKVRRGFKIERGRQNHLKLYQIKHYLNNNLAEKVGQSRIFPLTDYFIIVYCRQMVLRMAI